MPDHEESVGAIAHQSLEPLLARMHELLVEECSDGVPHDLFLLAAEVYAVGHRDGVRCAVADIAPTAARHGLGLWLDGAEALPEERPAVGAAPAGMPADPWAVPIRDAALAAAFAAARSHLDAAIDHLEASATLAERDGLADAVVRIGLEVEGHLECADAEITRVVARLEELRAGGVRTAG